jgi:hypothetical protein
MMKYNFILYVMLLCFSQTRAQMPSEYAITPPMGWNSWNSFGLEVTEVEVKATADYMAEHLLPFGWEYVVLDAGWYFPPEITTKIGGMKKPPQWIDEYGRLIPDETKFTSSADGAGFKPIADYVHSKGLKFGIHIMRGIPWNAASQKKPILGSAKSAGDVADYSNACNWSNIMVGLKMNDDASQAYYNSLFKLYAEWGVDYVKVDDVAREFRNLDMMAIAKAIENSGRKMVLSVSPGASPLNKASFFKEYTNMYRISNDLWDHWKFVPRQMEYCVQWYPHITEGHWPDIDMLPFGKLRITGGDDWVASLLEDSYENIGNELSRLTDIEKQTVMSLFCIFRSPLMFGGYFLESDEFSLSLITNQEALEVNQKSSNNKLLRKSGSLYIWMADNTDTGDKYVALFNLGETDQTMKFTLNELGIETESYVRDIWERSDMGIYSNEVSLLVKKHGSKFLKVSEKSKTAILLPSITNVNFAAVYPNPLGNTNYINIDCSKTMYAEINIYNQLGQLIDNTYSGLLTKGKNQIAINNRESIQGIHVLKINTKTEVLSFKMLFY